MSKELEKYGIQMPAFSKIGGILANEVRFILRNLKNVSFLLTNLLKTFFIIGFVLEVY